MFLSAKSCEVWARTLTFAMFLGTFELHFLSEPLLPVLPSLLQDLPLLPSFSCSKACRFCPCSQRKGSSTTTRRDFSRIETSSLSAPNGFVALKFFSSRDVQRAHLAHVDPGRECDAVHARDFPACPPGTWRSTPRERVTQFPLGTQLTSGKEDVANNSALAHHTIGNSMVVFALYRNSKHADTCTGPQSLLVCTVCGVGTGSGLGCLLRECTSQQSLSHTIQFCACTPRLGTWISA